jgi:hypothetical protein
MDATFNKLEIKQIKEVFREVLNEKMNRDTMQKLSNIEKNLEEYLKTSTDTLKVMKDNHKYYRGNTTSTY